MLLENERNLIVEYGRMMSESGLSTGTSGNISIFVPEEGMMAISPSGIGYFDTKPEDVVIMDLESKIIEGNRKPSSEWALHSEMYKRKPDCRSVVHTHSMYCTVFAALNQPLRAVHYVLADAGVASVPCAPYRTFGTVELAEVAGDHIGDSDAVLLANHGMLACGNSIKSAYGLAKGLEYCAELQYRAMCIGNPVILDDKEMEKVLVRFKSYGQVSRKEG